MRYFVCLILFFLPLEARESIPHKQKMMDDLDFIEGIFQIQYAPADWKGVYANWDLHGEIQKAKSLVQKHTLLPLKEYRHLLRNFFLSTKDYHSRILFYSTESAALPFFVKSAEGRYFVSHICSEKDLPFQTGDEVITFDGKPVAEVVEAIKVELLGNNSKETDQALAEIYLTRRPGCYGGEIPKNKATITLSSQFSGKQTTHSLDWLYTSEQIQDPLKKKAKKTLCSENHLLFPLFHQREERNSALEEKFFCKEMTTPFQNLFYASLEASCHNPHIPGARDTFLPDLGTKTWETTEDDVFQAYLFESEKAIIGFLRLPHYLMSRYEAAELAQVLDWFQDNSDALIIDQHNNSGGALFYCYAVLSMLTDRPLATPPHRICITQEDVYEAISLLEELETIHSDAQARKSFGDTLQGYAINLSFIQSLENYCHFIMKEWNAGRSLTEPYPLAGIEKIDPHPKVRYVKPILFLINALDLSAADFVPAILADNKRATLMGMRTAGSGGCLARVSYPNHFGIKEFTYTVSFAQREGNTPIENLGVLPHIPYTPTPHDLQFHYEEQKQAILKAVHELMR